MIDQQPTLDLQEIAEDDILAEEMGRYYADPLGFVYAAFDWDSPELREFGGPDVWATEMLEYIGQKVRANKFNGKTPVSAVRCAISSGHGTGKSVMTSWLILWIMSTRPFCKGIVSANSYTQLETKTWAELGKWLKRCVTGHWFVYNASKQSMRLRHKDHLENWRFDAQSCVEQNSESFAGLHAVDSTPCFIFDESSAIPDKIFEVAEGGLTDGEPMIFLFGNPTRCTGKFHAIFHRERAYWYTKQVDSRTVKITNKKLIKEWEDLWGEDSDFFRVRVKGEFPRASSMQLISTESVRAAQQRTLDADVYDWEVRIMAIDIARYGDDSTVFTFRQGRKLYKQIEYRELDLMKTSSLAVHYAKEFRAEVTFIDGAGVGGGVVDRCTQLGLNVVEVNGGAKPDEAKTYFNKRGEMYVRLRDWLKTADIPNAKESDQLFTELTALEFGFSNKNQLILERKEDVKKRLGFSPDFADSLAMTFAYLVTVDEYRQSAIEEEEKMVRSPYQGR